MVKLSIKQHATLVDGRENEQEGVALEAHDAGQTEDEIGDHGDPDG